MRLLHGTAGRLFTLRIPWQRNSPAATIRVAPTAAAKTWLRSKSPPAQSWLGQAKEKMDLVMARLKVCLKALILRVDVPSEYSTSILSDLRSGNLSLRSGDASSRSLWLSRYSARRSILVLCI